MTVDDILNRLDRVRETGNGKYLACCPAHEDRSPSLSVREAGDGRLLINCFAGCDVEAVLNALGLEFSDLFPESLGNRFTPTQQRISPREVLATLDHEALVVSLIGADFIRRQSLDDATWNRLAASVSRINSARAMAAPLRFTKDYKPARDSA